MLFLVGAVTGCSQGSNTQGNQQPVTPIILGSPVVSIDAMTTVPNLNGMSTKGVLYVHNYGQTVVNDISFTVKSDLIKDTVKSKQLMDTAFMANARFLKADIINNSKLQLSDVAKCTSIPAGGYCAISFTTPNLAFADSGNALITMNYNQDGKSQQTHQVVNYSYVDVNSGYGVNFLGGASVAMLQGKTRHVVGYLYAGGKTGTTYNNVEIDRSVRYDGLKVVRGFILGQQMKSGQIIPVEFELTRQNSQSLLLQSYAKWANPSLAGKSGLESGAPFNTGNPASLGINPVPENAVSFIIGHASIMRIPDDSSSTVNIINNGNVNADNGIEVSKVSGDGEANLNITNNCNSPLLKNAENSCQVSFDVSGYDSGNAVVEFKYHDTVIGTQTIYWINNKATPSIKATVNPNSVSYQVEDTPVEVITYTLQNIGKAPLQTASYAPKLTSSAIIDWAQSGNTCGTEINPGSTCMISGSFTPKPVVGTGHAYYSINGSYSGKNYSFVSQPVTYSVTGDPLLSISGSNETMQLLADGESTIVRTYTVTNISNVKATNIDLAIIDASANQPKPEISNSTCGSELNGQVQCEISVTYGPATKDPLANESGTAILGIDYAGGTSGSLNTQKPIDYKLVGNDSVLVMSEPTSDMQGSGTSGDAFEGLASVASQKISIEYHNTGLYEMVNFNINTNILPYGYKVASSSTCPSGVNTGSLAAGGTCTLVIELDQELLAIVPGAAANMTLDFERPEASWTTTFGSYHQSGNMIVHVTYKQAQLSVTANTIDTDEIISMSIANSDQLPNPSSVKVNIDQPLGGAPVVTAGSCTSHQEEDYGDGIGIYSVTCDLNAGEPQLTLPMLDYLLCGETADYIGDFVEVPSKVVIPGYFDFSYTAPACTP